MFGIDLCFSFIASRSGVPRVSAWHLYDKSLGFHCAHLRSACCISLAFYEL